MPIQMLGIFLDIVNTVFDLLSYVIAGAEG